MLIPMPPISSAQRIPAVMPAAKAATILSAGPAESIAATVIHDNFRRDRSGRT